MHQLQSWFSTRRQEEGAGSGAVIVRIPRIVPLATAIYSLNVVELTAISGTRAVLMRHRSVHKNGDRDEALFLGKNRHSARRDCMLFYVKGLPCDGGG